jgi:hypothetical protein
LDELEVYDTTPLGSDGTATRETNDTYTVYSGNYVNGLSQIKADLDLYWFLFRDNKLGLHLFPHGRFTEDLKPLYNAGVGVVFPFKDKTKENTIINIELYYNALDVFNTNDSEYGIAERNDIGIRFTFPINF